MPTSWNFDRACEELDSLLVLQRRRIALKEHPTLARMERLMHDLGNPQGQLRAIHITGTNGKTTTARLASALLSEQGLRVGCYSSPHMSSVTERMTIGDEPIDDSSFGELVGKVVAAADAIDETMTFFEAVTATALLWFAESDVDAVVIEVGLLGRWDATNVVDGAVAAVTNVGSDHIELAGSLEGVAGEKAGIVKPSSLLVLGETDQGLGRFFLERPSREVWIRGRDFDCISNVPSDTGRALKLLTPLAEYDDVELPLLGRHQGDNAAIALAAAEGLLDRKLSPEVVNTAFGRACSPGRAEIVHHDPICMLDGAHNVGGIEALISTLDEHYPTVTWALIYGALSGHAWQDAAATLAAGPISDIYVCEPPDSRAVSAADISGVLNSMQLRHACYPGVVEAVRQALSANHSHILITGSLLHLESARQVVEAFGRNGTRVVR